MATLRLRTPVDIGALIKDRRRAQRLGQAELAEKIGVSRLWVNQIEGGKPGASLGLVLRTLAALGVSLGTELASAPRKASRHKPVTHVDINEVVARAKRKAKK
jgi:HTH-type transcriptional regulator / antitoxin HipB